MLERARVACVQVGVTLTIMMSGMHLKLGHVAAVGKKSLGVALLGTCVPIALGYVALSAAALEFTLPDALSAGIALAPTSVGISVTLLAEAKALKSEFGQVLYVARRTDCWRATPLR